MTTSVTLFGTWLAFEFIHVTFLFFSLSFSLILSLYPFFFLYLSLSNLLLTVAQEKTVVQIGSDRHVVHIILYTRSLERGLSLVFDSSRNREILKKKKKKKLPISLREIGLYPKNYPSLSGCASPPHFGSGSPLVCLGFAFVDHYVRSRRGCEEENASKFVPSQRDTAGQPRPMTSIFGRCSAFKTRPEVSKPLRDRLFEVQPVTMSYYSRTGTLCNRFCISSSSFWVARSLLRTRFSLRSLSLRRHSTWFACSNRPRFDSLSISISI